MKKNKMFLSFLILFFAYTFCFGCSVYATDVSGGAFGGGSGGDPSNNFGARYNCYRNESCNRWIKVPIDIFEKLWDNGQVYPDQDTYGGSEANSPYEKCTDRTINKDGYVFFSGQVRNRTGTSTSGMSVLHDNDMGGTEIYNISAYPPPLMGLQKYNHDDNQVYVASKVEEITIKTDDGGSKTGYALSGGNYVDWEDVFTDKETAKTAADDDGERTYWDLMSQIIKAKGYTNMKKGEQELAFFCYGMLDDTTEEKESTDVTHNTTIKNNSNSDISNTTDNPLEIDTTTFSNIKFVNTLTAKDAHSNDLSKYAYYYYSSLWIKEKNAAGSYVGTSASITGKSELNPRGGYFSSSDYKWGSFTNDGINVSGLEYGKEYKICQTVKYNPEKFELTYIYKNGSYQSIKSFPDKNNLNATGGYVFPSSDREDESCYHIKVKNNTYSISTESKAYYFEDSTRRTEKDEVEFGGSSSGRVRLQFEHNIKMPAGNSITNDKTISTKLSLGGDIVSYNNNNKSHGVGEAFLVVGGQTKSLSISNDEQNIKYVGFSNSNSSNNEYQNIVGVCGYEHGDTDLNTCDEFVKLGEKIELEQMITAIPATFNINSSDGYGSFFSSASVSVGHPYNFDLYPNMVNSSGSITGNIDRGAEVELNASIVIKEKNSSLSRTYTPKNTIIRFQYQGYNDNKSELNESGWNDAGDNTISKTVGSTLTGRTVEYGFVDSGNGVKRDDDTKFKFTIPDEFSMRNICFRVGVNYVDSFGYEYDPDFVAWSRNWRFSDYNGNTFGSQVYCLKVSKRSSFQMWGGNVYAQGDISAVGIVKDDSNKIFGSWTDYGLVAGGEVKSVASGAGLIKGVNNDNASAFCRMMIANTSSPCNSSRGGGNSGIGRTGIGEKILSMTKEDLESAFGNDVTIVKQSSGNINISGNVENKTVYVVEGNITIGNNVEKINGWLVAGGYIYTGHNTATNTTCMPNGNNCDRPLIINGAVFANRLELQRNGGDPRKGLDDDAYAEKIIFNPNDYIKIYQNVRAESIEKGNFVKVYEKELPPRY